MRLSRRVMGQYGFRRDSEWSTLRGMAKKTIIESDVSGKPGASTYVFALGTEWYEIDLTEDEVAELEKAMESYRKKGRKRGARGVRRVNREVPKTTARQRQEIRAWARENGHEVEARGQIPKHVFSAYVEAHGGKLPGEE